MTEQIDPYVEQYTLRNAYQWLAMLTITLDHIGYLYYIPTLRYFGRLGMPLYAILFVMTVRSGRINFKRLLFLALASQWPCMYIFEVSKLNIIFGFAIFAWIVKAFEEQQWFRFGLGLLMMLIPVAYDWYLYATLFIFYCLRKDYLQRFAFAVATVIYTFSLGIHLRQLLAIGVPFIQGIQAVRPNKYLYRYFYPGHLVILAVLKYLYMHAII